MNNQNKDNTTAQQKNQLLRESILDAVAIQSGLPKEMLDSTKYESLIDSSFDWISDRIIGQIASLKNLRRLLKNKIAEHFIGWGEAVRTLQPNWESRPIASILAAGPTGVGKTETAKLLAEKLFGGRIVTLNGSDVGPEARHGTSMWTGSPPGFVGSDRGGILTNFLRAHHSGIILIDEIEKADNNAIQNIILPLMGEGIVSDRNNGETLFATDFIIFCTSNISLPDDVSETEAGPIDKRLFDSLAIHLRPEIIGRFNTVLKYANLEENAKMEIWKTLSDEFAQKIGKETVLCFNDEALSYLREQFSSIQTGARAIKDIFQAQVVPQCVNACAGETITIGVVKNSLIKIDCRTPSKENADE